MVNSQVIKEGETVMVLADLSAGSECSISGLELPVDQIGRLRNLGIVEGQRVRVISTGKPIIVEILKTRIGINRGLASGLRVTSVAQSA